MIDILVLNYNDAVTTTSFVNSVRDYSCVRKILAVDNHSKDDSMECLKALEDDKVLVVDSGENKGYGAGNNFGIRYLYEHFNSEYILLCNPDVIIEEQVCEKLEDFLRTYDDYAIAAPFMLNAKLQHQCNTAFFIPKTYQYIMSLSIVLKKFICSFDCGNLAEQSDETVYDVGAVSGSLFMINVSKMLQYGMFDENIFLYCEEIVLGAKMGAAHQKIALLPKLTFVHNHSVSISKSYNTLLKKHRLYLKSKVYVINKYFRPNFFEKILVYTLKKVSMFEIYLISLERKFKKKGR